MTPPPPAEQLSTRIFLGPALRTQSDRRLVKLVREGYETAFEEIVRRYRRPLDRFAAAFVGGRSEDVTQDAFSKALLALRGSEAEIELRPWLYRIVRNTALNDLRDRPPAAEQLGEDIATGRSAAVEAERREEMAELMQRLRALPEPQRAAIVMRELEGLSHDEIAAALGISGGGARQQIYRARIALRNGLGMLVPLPLLRLLFDHGAEAAAGAGGAAGAASAGGGAALGGVGAAGAFKLGVATIVLAGSVGAGVAVQNDRGAPPGPATTAAEASFTPGGGPADGGSSGRGSGGAVGSGDSREHGSGDDNRGEDRGRGRGGDGRDDSGHGSSGHGGPGPSESGGSGRGSGRSGSDEDSGGGSHSGRGSDGGSGSGRGGPEDGSGGHGEPGSGSGRGGSGGGGSSGKGGSESGGRDSSDGGGHGGSSDDSGGDSSGSGSSGSGGSEPDSGRDGSGSGGGPEPVPPPDQPPSESSGSGSSGSGSGGSGSGDSGSGSGSDRTDDGS